MCRLTKKTDKERARRDTATNAGLAGASADVVDRYGSGVKEHIVGYSGVDNELGTSNERGLKRISEYRRGDPKTAPNYQTNTRQQAGFAAETKEVARRRAEEAIAGKKPTTTRTDDIIGPDGQKHHVNDQLFDITTEVDAQGNPVPGASYQMKFVGGTPKAAVDKMLSQDYQKYIDNDVKMMVPSDYYDGMQEALDDKISDLEGQVKHLKAAGKSEAAAAKQAQLDKCRTLKKNLVKSKVSNAEAIEARNNAKWSTAKDIGRVAHRAGVEQAKIGAAIGGGMSLIRNLVDVCKGEKSGEEAALAVVGDTTRAAAVSYTTAFGGAVIKGTMQNAGSEVVRSLAKTNLPGYIATSTLEVGKTLTSFFKGDIDGVQCLEQLGEKGYGMVNSALYAAIGQLAIPIPVVGALVGSMLGYALSSASYHVLTDSLKEAKFAREERIRVEAEVREAIAMLREYRAELEKNISLYLKDTRDFFDETFSRMKTTLQTGDIDGYIASANSITRKMGKRPIYETFSQFDSMMVSDEPLKF
ncbi:MAG: hypothetical protein IJS08_00880 [Victivallales bacterium]|nr:hypothetical protein [Victivallales bacterium]